MLIRDDRYESHQKLADKHRHTLFLRANVENAPFLTTRLGIKVLPCVVCFVDGNAVDRYVHDPASRHIGCHSSLLLYRSTGW